jgi:hypothetical protein
MTLELTQEEIDALTFSEVPLPDLGTNSFSQAHNWSKEEDELLTNIITTFKTSNPTKPFWNNPLCEVDAKIWDNIAKIYQSFAEGSELTPISASNIESRWKENINPLLIKDPVFKHGEKIGALYDKTTGDFEARAQQVEKEFCRLHTNGSYYPLNKIKAFLEYYTLEETNAPLPQNSHNEITLPIATTRKRHSEEAVQHKTSQSHTLPNDSINSSSSKKSRHEEKTEDEYLYDLQNVLGSEDIDLISPDDWIQFD